MIQSVSIKVTDKTGLNEREVNIMQAALLNVIAMTDTLLVGTEGGEGSALNPLEDDKLLGITLVYQKAIKDELAEKLKGVLERKLNGFFKMGQVDMEVEIELF